MKTFTLAIGIANIAYGIKYLLTIYPGVSWLMAWGLYAIAITELIVGAWNINLWIREIKKS